MDLTIRVREIKGTCPIYRVGQSFEILDGFRLKIPEGQSICLHGLASVMPFYRALAGGISPREMGLECGEEKACVHCPDCAELTGGGSVIFEIEARNSPQ